MVIVLLCHSEVWQFTASKIIYKIKFEFKHHVKENLTLVRILYSINVKVAERRALLGIFLVNFLILNPSQIDLSQLNPIAYSKKKRSDYIQYTRIALLNILDRQIIVLFYPQKYDSLATVVVAETKTKLYLLTWIPTDTALNIFFSSVVKILQNIKQIQAE